MRRLTNKQMEVLSARVTDLLQDAHKKEHEELHNSPEYIDFDTTYVDEKATKLRELAKKHEELDIKIDNLRGEMRWIEEQVKNMRTKEGKEVHNWRTYNPKDELESYLQHKKNEKYAHAEFNYDKTLRRVQADILLSDIENPDELVKSLVAKLKEENE